MSVPTQSVRILPFVLAAVALAASVTGCGSDDTSATGASAGAGVPEAITIAYQAIPNGDLVVKHEKWLEQALPDTKITWKLFESGGDVNQAVAAGSVDLGLAGSSPVSRGLSTKIPYQVPWIFDVIGSNEALAVKSDITSFADLKGKTIATPFASTSHLSLLRALEKNGLTERDVKVIDAEPSAIAAAWSRGDIDGAYTWNPSLATILDSGGHTLITSADLAREGVLTYDLGVATNDFASKYPDALKIWATQQDRAVKLLQDDPQKAAVAIGAELDLKPDEALAQTKGLIFVRAADQAGPKYLGEQVGKDLYDSAVFNKDLGQITSVEPKATYTDAVTTEAARAAADANK